MQKRREAQLLKWNQIEDMGYKEVDFQHLIFSEKTSYAIDHDVYHFITRQLDVPPIGAAQCSLFPYGFESNHISDFKDWDIEKQNEAILGHNTIVLKGKLEHNSFRFWVGG